VTLSDTGILAHERGRAIIPSLAAYLDGVLPDGPTTEPGGTNMHTALTLQCLAARMALDAGDLTAARAWLEALDHWLAWSGATLGQAEGHSVLGTRPSLPRR